MKKSNDIRVTQLENSQINMAMMMKNMENIQSTMGASMRDLETNQASFNVIIKNLETQMGQMTQSLKQNSSKSFPSDTLTNPKYCIDVTLKSGREMDDSIEVKRQVEIETEEKNAEAEKESASA